MFESCRAHQGKASGKPALCCSGDAGRSQARVNEHVASATYPTSIQISPARISAG
jgi:hypothetical protein